MALEASQSDSNSFATESSNNIRASVSDDVELASDTNDVQLRSSTRATAPLPRSATPPSAELQPPTTPRTDNTAILRTPEPLMPRRIPSTPHANPSFPSSVASYLSSPIRSSRSTNPFTNGVMTPGRPSLKLSHQQLSRPYPMIPLSLKSPKANNKLGTKLGTGKVNLSTSNEVPDLPVQTLFLTPERALEIQDLGTARESLAQAMIQLEQLRVAAQRMRNLANHHAFQHKLLQVEFDENEQRNEVETNIRKREIEKLVIDIMGMDRSSSIEQISRKLKKTRQRSREMTEIIEAKDQQIKELQVMLAQSQGLGPLQPIYRPQTAPVFQNSTLSKDQDSHSNNSHESDNSPKLLNAEKVRPPPISTKQEGSLSNLELLASQTLINGFQNSNTSAVLSASNHSAVLNYPASVASAPASANPSVYGSSPLNSPYYTPFSPYAIPPHYSRKVPNLNFGSPEKRRRPSSSSTISAMSEDDTLEEPNV